MLFFILIFFIFSCLAEPLLVVLCMVKNEATVIIPTLQPFSDAGIDTFLIIDTGSEDTTKEKVHEFFTKNKIKQGYLEEEPFVDFATSRNHVLTRAEILFPDATFFIMIDAEWYLYNAKELIQFCKTQQNQHYPAYVIDLNSKLHTFRNCCLFRRTAKLRYKGVVHETIDCKQKCGLVPPSIYFMWDPSRGGEQKTCHRLYRDLHLLTKSFEENPHDARTIFYLAQTHSCLNNFEEAVKLYNLYLKFSDYQTERSLALYRLGLLTQYLASKDPITYTWHNAFDYYLEAYATTPERIEPLIAIADYYLTRQPAISYIFSKHALDVEPLITDSLILEKEHYEFTRFELLAKSAWAVQDLDIGIFACHQALATRPNNLELKNLLTWYLQAKRGTNS